MTKKIDDGGPVYPITIKERDPNSYPTPSYYEKQFFGMNLRDHFAAQAIPAIIERCGADHRQPHEHIADYFARKAYEVADAMLLARKAGEA